MKTTKAMKNRIFYSLFIGVLFSGFLFVSCSKDDEVIEPTLSASFSFEGGDRPAPAPVEFTSSTELATELQWDFGDGNESTDENPTHTFTEAGSYEVVLTAFDEAGESKTYKRTIEVWKELAGWHPKSIRLEHAFLKQLSEDGKLSLDDFAYLYLLNDNKERINYNNDQVSGFDLNQNFWDNEYSLSFSMEDYPADPINLNMNESITIQFYAHPMFEASNPSENQLLFEKTISSADFIPEEETSPYAKRYTEEGGLNVSINWNEK